MIKQLFLDNAKFRKNEDLFKTLKLDLKFMESQFYYWKKVFIFEW